MGCTLLNQFNIHNFDRCGISWWLERVPEYNCLSNVVKQGYLKDYFEKKKKKIS